MLSCALVQTETWIGRIDLWISLHCSSCIRKGVCLPHEEHFDERNLSQRPSLSGLSDVRSSYLQVRISSEASLRRVLGSCFRETVARGELGFQAAFWIGDFDQSVLLGQRSAYSQLHPNRWNWTLCLMLDRTGSCGLWLSLLQVSLDFDLSKRCLCSAQLPSDLVGHVVVVYVLDDSSCWRDLYFNMRRLFLDMHVESIAISHHKLHRVLS